MALLRWVFLILWTLICTLIELFFSSLWTSIGVLMLIGGLVFGVVSGQANSNFGMIGGVMVAAIGAVILYFCYLSLPSSGSKEMTSSSSSRSCHDIDPNAYRQD